ncbi:DAN domain-containing protein [Aphelenchoides avenae]|nr:DAN domain-containing protein [Aphelenchus avenae]
MPTAGRPSASEGTSNDVDDRDLLEDVSNEERERLLYNVARPVQADDDRDENAVSSKNHRDVLERSRNAFMSLQEEKPAVEETLEPDENRKQKWLEQHRAKKEKMHRKNRPHPLTRIPGHVLQKNQTCKADLFKHKIRMAGCEPKIILNRFCHGACTSFYIPKLRTKKLKATFQSCAACVPAETDIIQVKLDCPEREEKEITRTVMLVKRCACRNIDLGDDSDEEDV